MGCWEGGGRLEEWASGCGWSVIARFSLVWCFGCSDVGGQRALCSGFGRGWHSTLQAKESVLENCLTFPRRELLEGAIEFSKGDVVAVGGAGFGDGVVEFLVWGEVTGEGEGFFFRNPEKLGKLAAVVGVWDGDST